MENARLTRSADEMLCGLYEVFRQREAAGEPRASARCFNITDDFQSDVLRELHNAGFIKRIGWDKFVLEYVAIVYMENRPDIIDTALDVLTRIKNAIPFI